MVFRYILYMIILIGFALTKKEKLKQKSIDSSVSLLVSDKQYLNFNWIWLR